MLARARLRERFSKRACWKITLSPTLVSHIENIQTARLTRPSRVTQIASHAQRNSIQKSSTGKLRSFKSHGTLGVRSHQTATDWRISNQPGSCIAKPQNYLVDGGGGALSRCPERKRVASAFRHYRNLYIVPKYCSSVVVFELCCGIFHTKLLPWFGLHSRPTNML